MQNLRITRAKLTDDALSIMQRSVVWGIASEAMIEAIRDMFDEGMYGQVSAALSDLARELDSINR